MRSPREECEIADRIRASGARVVLVGLGCPRQEVFAYAMRPLLDMPLLAVGAAFDYHAGLLRKPPPWMQRHGLEWLWRLGLEPQATLAALPGAEPGLPGPAGGPAGEILEGHAARAGNRAADRLRGLIPLPHRYPYWTNSGGGPGHGPDSLRAELGNARFMDIDLVILIAVAVVWLTAGIVADGLPQLDSPGALRRRTTWLLTLTMTGLGAMAVLGLAALVAAGPTVADRAPLALVLPAVPATAVALLTVRRLRRLRAGAGAFATAPDAPVPPALRAAAAHPMIALPLQVAGLVTLPALVAATAVVPFTASALTGFALTAGLATVSTIGVRHALRHSRLAEGSITVRPDARASSARATRVLHV